MCTIQYKYWMESLFRIQEENWKNKTEQKTEKKTHHAIAVQEGDSQLFPVQSAGRSAPFAAVACCSTAAVPSAPLSAGGAALSAPAAWGNHTDQKVLTEGPYHKFTLLLMTVLFFICKEKNPLDFIFLLSESRLFYWYMFTLCVNDT